MRAHQMSVTLSRIAVQYLALIFHQHTGVKDVITSKVVATAFWRPRFVHRWIRWAETLRLYLAKKNKFNVHVHTASWSRERKGSYTASE
jgi:hypothetical protein